MSLSRAVSWLAPRAAFPGVVVVSLASAHGLLAWGVAPGVTVTATFVLTLLVVMVLERALPHDPSWNPSSRELREDGAYLVLAALLQPLARLGGHWGAAMIALVLVDGLGVGAWPPGWPTWATIALAMALADLGKYGLHRLSHEHAWLFRFHAEHHAPSRVYSLNGVRLHPVNLLWNLVLDAGVPVLLGLEGEVVAMIAVFRGAVAVLQHANVEVRVGPLSWVLSTPDLHRWHHSTVMVEANANYGSTWIVWDVLFGTRKLPEGRPREVGLAEGGDHRPASLLHQLAWPWCASRRATCWALRGWTPRA